MYNGLKCSWLLLHLPFWRESACYEYTLLKTVDRLCSCAYTVHIDIYSICTEWIQESGYENC